jgi:hypothetical protein
MTTAIAIVLLLLLFIRIVLAIPKRLARIHNSMDIVLLYQLTTGNAGYWNRPVQEDYG